MTTAGYELGAQIRRLNLLIERLPVTEQAAMRQDWIDDLDMLEAERKAAPDDVQEIAVVERWASHWRARLERVGDGGMTFVPEERRKSLTYAGRDSTHTYDGDPLNVKRGGKAK